MAFSTGAQTKRGISAIAMLDKREIGKNFIDVYNEAGLMDIASLGGKYEAVTQPIFHDFYNDALFIKLDTTGATVTGSGTATVETTLTAATSGYVRKGQKLLQVATGKVVQVQSVETASSQDTITLKATDGSNITHTAGQIFTPLTVLVGERSSAVTSLKHTPSKYFNLIEHAREAYEITDVQLQSDVEVEFEGSNYIWNKEIAEAFMRFKAAQNANLIASQISSAKFEDASIGFADPGNGGAQQTQRGLDQYATTYGVTDSIDTLGSPDFDDYEDFSNLLTAARAPMNYIGYCSDAVSIKFSKFAKGLNSSGVTSGRMSLDGKEIDFNATTIHVGMRRLQVVVLPILNHPVFFSGSDIQKSMYWVPEGSAPIYGGGSKPFMSICYQKQVVNGNMGNDIWSEWDSGALARQGAQGDEMVRRTNWHTAQGLRVLAPQFFGRQKYIS